MKIRLNKFLASLGIASRRKIDVLMERGQVRVNEKRVKPGYKIDPEKDLIAVGRKKVHDPSKKTTQTQVKKEYWMVNKPPGYVSTTNDPLNRPTVTGLVKSSTRLYPVGRLDVDSEGLVILTNDGDLTQKLTHPKHHVPKTYVVKIKGGLSHRSLETLRDGVRLKKVKTMPAQVTVLEKDENEMLLEIILKQGLNRQIRRMMKAVNAEVVKLRRVAIGNLQLGELKPKRVKKLTKDDLLLLK